jgi:hypothetical protein
MSGSSQTLLGRTLFGSLVAASLTFGAAQAFGASASLPCASGYTCTTRPSDSGCAAYCLQQYPDNLGTHFCSGAVPGGYCCVCAE